MLTDADHALTLRTYCWALNVRDQHIACVNVTQLQSSCNLFGGNFCTQVSAPCTLRKWQGFFFKMVVAAVYRFQLYYRTLTVCGLFPSKNISRWLSLKFPKILDQCQVIITTSILYCMHCIVIQERPPPRIGVFKVFKPPFVTGPVKIYFFGLKNWKYGWKKMS